jgi:hypothetical protein
MELCSIPPHAFMAWCLIKYRDNFIFTFIVSKYRNSFLYVVLSSKLEDYKTQNTLHSLALPDVYCAVLRNVRTAVTAHLHMRSCVRFFSNITGNPAR